MVSVLQLWALLSEKLESLRALPGLLQVLPLRVLHWDSVSVWMVVWRDAGEWQREEPAEMVELPAVLNEWSEGPDGMDCSVSTVSKLSAE